MSGVESSNGPAFLADAQTAACTGAGAATQQTAAGSSQGSGWSPVPLRPVIEAQPAECLEEGSD